MVRDVSEHEIQALQHELVLKDILAAADKLPPFSDIVWKVMPLIQRMAPVNEIEAVIQYDQTITSRVLSLCQSAYYRRRHSISSLHDAIVRLGNRKLIQVIMTASAASYFERGGRREARKERQIWEHSVSVAVMAEQLARRMEQKNVLKIYLAGLLHDIGQAVLARYIRIHADRHVDISAIDNEHVIELERRALGIDHQKLGAIITRRWRLPVEVVIGIGHHHHPFQAKSDQSIAIILYAADKISWMALSADESEPSMDPLKDEAFIKLGIANPHTVEHLKSGLMESMDEIKSFLSTR